MNNSCNLTLPGDDGFSETIFDVDYVNDMSQKLILVSYKDGIIKDKFEIKANSKKRFNNVTLKKDGSRINSPFQLNTDSVLAIIEIEVQGANKYKNYIKQCDNVVFSNEEKPCMNLTNNDNLLNGYGAKSINSFQRKWYSLNKGEFLYRYELDKQFFKNPLKMYDYEKRGF